jgi:N-acetylmuramoyl-L-alanine amidase
MTVATMGKQISRLLKAEFAKKAERIFLCALCVLYSSTAFALPPVQTMYTEALAREQAVREDERGTAAPPLATIKAIRRTVLPDAVRITIELDGEVPFRDQRISDPSRVFVDLPGTRAAPRLLDHTLRFETDADVVRQVRIGRHPHHTTRVVLDVAGVTSYSVYPLYDPYRLVIDCVRAQETVTADAKDPPSMIPAARPREATPLRARRLTAEWLRRLPSASPRAAKLIAGAYAADGSSAKTVPDPRIVGLAPVAPVAPPTPVPRQLNAESATAAARNLNGRFSIARQLGLGISRVVIDPGHGGYDPGAKGKAVTEAEIVLDVALRLEALLQKAQGFEVILTRRTDDFIPLPERTAIANREGADLFLSIHANASPNGQARGVETYFLNFANNLTAAAVATRENAASGQAMAALPDFVKAIALNNKLDESRDFAMHVQRAMVARLRTANTSVRDLGVKQAPFVVLIGAAMPSVLAEISFVTNPQEARLLKGTVYRQRIAESLFNAIRKYQGSLKNAKAVALQ